MSQTIQATAVSVPPGHDEPRAASETCNQPSAGEEPAPDVVDLRRGRATAPTVPDSSYYLG